MKPLTKKELETEYRAHLKGCRKHHKKRLEEEFAGGSFGHHELLHLSWVVAEMFDHYLLRHPTTALEKDLFYKAQQISDDLFGFYQRVSRSST